MKTINNQTLTVDVQYPQLADNEPFVTMRATIKFMGAWITYTVTMKTFAPYEILIHKSDHTFNLSEELCKIISDEARMLGRWFYERSQAAREQSA